MFTSKAARRVTLGAVLVLVLMLAVPVMAAPPRDMVTGGYTYYTFSDVPRTVSVSAFGTDPLRGRWSWHEPYAISGPVTCLRISENDAWMAGPTWDGMGAVFLWVHDGGTPGSDGDTAFTWNADPGETLDDMEALCENMTTSPYGYDAFDVVRGNVNVWDAP